MSDPTPQAETKPIHPNASRLPPTTWHKGMKSPNPRGRPSAGASVREWINQLVDEGKTPAELSAITRDPAEKVAKIMAARQLLQAVELPDPAVFEELAAGNITLRQARAQGLPTEQIKKSKRVSRRIEAEGGNIETETVFELELHDRAGDAFDRIMDRTEGRPNQAIQLQAPSENDGEDTVLTNILDNPDAIIAALEFERTLLQPRGTGQDVDPKREEPG